MELHVEGLGLGWRPCVEVGSAHHRLWRRSSSSRVAGDSNTRKTLGLRMVPLPPMVVNAGAFSSGGAVARSALGVAAWVDLIQLEK